MEFELPNHIGEIIQTQKDKDSMFSMLESKMDDVKVKGRLLFVKKKGVEGIKRMVKRLLIISLRDHHVEINLLR